MGKSTEICGNLKPLLHPVVHARTSWLQSCKGHLSYTFDFITEFQGHTDSTMKIDMHIFSACTQYGQKRIHFSRVTYETCERAFPLQMLQDLPIHLQGWDIPYNTLTCTLHPY